MSLTIGTYAAQHASRETVANKARRLVRQDRITFLDGVFTVKGDHGTYVVQLNEQGHVSCSCHWRVSRPEDKPCSHILAVVLKHPAPSPEPPRPRQNIFARYSSPVRVTNAHALAALRHLADVTTMWLKDIDDTDFAICEEAVLNIALRMADGGCGR